jgi:probable rRNA maturation factor
MTLTITNEVEAVFDFDYEQLAEDVISFTMEHEDFPYEAEVNLTITDNDGIRQINKEFRGIDSPTDVLSFPMMEYDTPGDFTHFEDDYDDNFNPDTGELMLGDIIISHERAKEQAKEFGHSIRREVAFLIVHSMLHLFGYDHMADDEAAVMESKQRDILGAMNISRD